MQVAHRQSEGRRYQHAATNLADGLRLQARSVQSTRITQDHIKEKSPVETVA